MNYIEDFLKGEDKKNSKEYNYTNMDVKNQGKQADLQESKITRYHDVYFDCGPPTRSYASLVYLGMHASRKVWSWQKVSHLLEQEYRVVARSNG